MHKWIWMLVLAATAPAQIVDTVALISADGDLAGGPEGVLYVSDSIATVYEIAANGTFRVFADFEDGIERPLGLFYDADEKVLYVANTPLNKLGWISKVNADGSAERLADGLNLPTSLTLDDQKNVYASLQNNSIVKITPDGTTSEFIRDTAFNRPHGIAWADGVLYVASAHSGNIYAVESNPVPSARLLTHVDGLQQPWACGFMVHLNDHLYITNGDNNIYEIDKAGTVNVLAGTGQAGYVDGLANESQFNQPNGIGHSLDGKLIYVAEWSWNRVRVITSAGIVQNRVVLPWIVNNPMWSSEIGIYNDAEVDLQLDLTAVTREGASMHSSVTVKSRSLFSAKSADLFGDLTGYALYVGGVSDDIHASYLTFNLEPQSGGYSPSETIGSEFASLTSSVLFAYLQTDEIPAIVVVAPEAETGEVTAIDLELFTGEGHHASTTLTLTANQPSAFLVSDVFDLESVSGAVSVIASTENGTRLAGTSFVFNQQRQPSMAKAISI